jgi:hypothetical protein
VRRASLSSEVGSEIRPLKEGLVKARKGACFRHSLPRALIGVATALFIICDPVDALMDGTRATDAYETVRDVRLHKRMELRVRARPLSEVLGTISARTGVTMRAAKDVADLRVTIFVRDLTIRSLQESLAALLHLTWRQEGTSNENRSLTYVLYRSSRDREEEHLLASMQERAFRQAVDDSIRALSLSPEARRKLIGDRYQLEATVNSRQGAPVVELLGGLPRSQRQEFLDGGSLKIKVSDLPPSMHRPLETLAGSKGFGERGGPVEHLELRRSEGDAQGFYLTLTGNGRRTRTRVELSSGMDTYRRYYAGKQASKDGEAAPLVVRESLTASTFDALLEKFSEHLRINAMAEAYEPADTLLSPPIPAGETTLKAVLDQAILGGQFWWSSGNVYLFQSKFWFLDRQAQVSENTVQWLKKKKQEYGNLLVVNTLSLEDWKVLGRLHPKQWMTLENYGLGPFTVSLPSRYPVLAFFGHLTDANCRALFSSEGLDSRSLPAEDRIRLARWVSGAVAVRGRKEYPPLNVAWKVFAIVKGDRTVFTVTDLLNKGTDRAITESTVLAIPESARRDRKPQPDIH